MISWVKKLEEANPWWLFISLILIKKALDGNASFNGPFNLFVEYIGSSIYGPHTEM